MNKTLTFVGFVLAYICGQVVYGSSGENSNALLGAAAGYLSGVCIGLANAHRFRKALGIDKGHKEL